MIPQSNTNINKVLSDITNELVGQFNLNELLNRIVDMAMRLLNAEVCSIFLDNKDKYPGKIVMLAGSGFAKKLVGKAEYSTGEGLTGYIYKTGLKFNIKTPDEFQSLKDDKTQCLIWAGKQDPDQWPSGKNEFRNLIAFPLRIKDEIFGVIKVENKIESIANYFPDEDETIFEIIANVVALAIENARLYQKIESQLKAISAKAAHRINNQCTNYDGIELDLELELSNSICNKENIKGIAERIKGTTQNLKKMIGEFKDYGKPLSLDKKLCNVNKTISDEIWLAKPPLNISITQKMDDKIPMMQIDGGRFAESMKELISNAKKAIDKNKQATGQIHIYSELKEHEVLIGIEDDGPGFPASFPVFEPFNSTDPQSTGLGLTTVKELVERHGGKIACCKGTLKGACIRFTLPIVNL